VHAYPVQTSYNGYGSAASATNAPPPKVSSKVSDDEDYVAQIYDAPAAHSTSSSGRGSSAAPGSSYGRPGRRRSHHRINSGSGQGEETLPLIGAPSAMRSVPGPGGRSGDEWGQSNPPPGILREPRRSRVLSSDGPLLGGLPPISPAKPMGGVQVYDAGGGGGGGVLGFEGGGFGGSSGTSRDEMIAAHDRLQHRPIRSSGIGATKKPTKHRRARSATDGPVTSLLLKDDDETGRGYGAISTATKAPVRRHSFQKLPTFGGEVPSPMLGNRRPSYRRGSSELPPANRSGRRSPSPSRESPRRLSGSNGARRSTGSADGPGVAFEGGDGFPSPLPPRPRARTSSTEGHGVHFFESDSPPASPLPPRPRGRTSSTENVPRDPFAASLEYMTPLEGSLTKPGHRRVDSATSAASMSSAFSFVSDMSVTSYISDFSKSKLFRRISETGDVQLHLPIDNVRLTMDPDLEAGEIYKQKDDDEIERYEDYHLLCTDPTAGFDLDDDLACGCDCQNCNQCIAKREALPDVRYVLNVDPDLYKRVLSEIADSRSYPCGLYYCGHHEDVDTPSIWIAVGIVLIVFLVMAAMTIWAPYE